MRATGRSASGCSSAAVAANAGDDHGNCNRIQQNRQQHVAAARADEHRREERAHCSKPDRPGRQQQRHQQRKREQRRMEHQGDERRHDRFDRGQQQQHARELPHIQRRPIHRCRASARAAYRSGVRVRTCVRARACRRRQSRSTECRPPRRQRQSLRGRTRTRTPGRTRPQRTASCRRLHDCGIRSADPFASPARRSPRTTDRPSGFTIGSSIAIAQRPGPLVDRRQTTAPQQNGAVGHAVDRFQIVGGNENDASGRSRDPQAGVRSANVAASSSPVKGSSSRTSRGSCSNARSSARRCRMPRENLPAGSSRCSRPARSSATFTVTIDIGHRVGARKEREVFERG